MDYLIIALAGSFLGLFGVVFFQNRKLKSSQSLIDTIPLKNQLNDLTQTISQASGLLGTEEDKRKEALKTKETVKDVSEQELVDFFNSNLNSDK